MAQGSRQVVVGEAGYGSIHNGAATQLRWRMRLSIPAVVSYTPYQVHPRHYETTVQHRIPLHSAC